MALTELESGMDVFLTASARAAPSSKTPSPKPRPAVKASSVVRWEGWGSQREHGQCKVELFNRGYVFRVRNVSTAENTAFFRWHGAITDLLRGNLILRKQFESELWVVRVWF